MHYLYDTALSLELLSVTLPPRRINTSVSLSHSIRFSVQVFILLGACYLAVAECKQARNL